MSDKDRDIRKVLDDDTLARVIKAAGPRRTPPAEAYNAVFEASHAAWQTKLSASRRQRWRYALAASVAVAVCSVLFLQFVNPDQATLATMQLVRGDVALFSSDSGNWMPLRERGTPLKKGDRVRTAGSAGVALQLASGVSLRLSENSELEVDADEVLNLIAGTAYIDSGGTNRSVQFTTPLGIVRDIGTQFEVRITDADLRVRVRSGLVEIQQNNLIETASAEQQFELSRNGRISRSEISAQNREWAWAEALAVVPDAEDLSIATYLSWAANELGRPLVFESDSTKLSAEFESWYGNLSGLSPKEIFDVIEAGSVFEIAPQADGGLLVSRK
jgi:ferric-dicitrate binding protein FerR (iron transport regulator)